MTLQVRLVAEAILEELRHETFRIRQRGDAVAKVTRRQHAQVAPQPPRAAAIVGDGDDGGDVVRVFFEAAQEGVEPVPAADRHNLRPPLALPVAVDDIGDLRLVGALEGGDDRMVHAVDGPCDQRAPGAE